MELFLDFVFVSGITVISIIIGVLIKSKKKQLPHRVLIVFFSFLLLVSIFFYAGLHNIEWLFNLTFIPNDMVPMIIGPLLYLYIKSLFLEEKKLVQSTLVHFIPILIFVLFISIPTVIFFIFKIDALSYVHSEYITILFRIEFIYIIVYLTISLQLLSKYRRLMKSKYSNLSQNDYKWIKTVLIGSIVIVSFDLIAETYESYLGHSIWYQEYLIVATMIFLVVYLGYYGVNQSKVLLPDFLLEKEKGSRTKTTIILNSHKEEFVKLENQLKLILSKSQPYLDEDLTLGKLASQLFTTDKKLSMLLNQFMGTTFYDLINKYRVEAVIEKMQLEAYKDYNLFGIACECGFKSRTSFNRIFKKETGYSPSTYKENIN